MWRKLLVSVVAVGMLGAWTPPQKSSVVAKDDAGRPAIHRDGGNGTPIVRPHFTEVIQDSSVNQYTTWTNTQESMSAMGDYMIYGFRGWEADGSGYIAVIMSADGGNTFRVDRRINEATGIFEAGGRYPDATYDPTYPGPSWPELVSGPAWGKPAIATTLWDSPGLWYGADGGNLSTHKNNSYAMDNGMILNVAADLSDNILVAIYDPSTGSFTTNFTPVATGGFDGADYYNGTAIIFFDQNWGLYYITSTDNGQTWSSPQLLWQAPGDKWWWWAQGIIKPNGSPAAIFCVGDTAEAQAPFWREVLYVDADGNEVRLDNTSPEDKFCNYVWLTRDADNGVIYATWNELETYVGDTIVGYGYWDVYGSASMDGGATWTGAHNLTNTPNEQESAVRVAKDVANGKIWMVSYSAPGEADPWSFISPFGIMPDVLVLTYSNVAYATPADYGVDVAESTPVSREKADLTVVHDLDNRKVTVNFTLPTAGPVELALYDASGRRVAALAKGTLTAGFHTYRVDSRYLSNGTYFVRLQTPEGTISQKFVFVR